MKTPCNSVVATLLCALIAPVTLASEVLVSTPSEVRPAVAAARPGDTVILKDGVWNDAQLILDGVGAKDKPLTIRAQTPGKVVFTGKSRLWFSGDYIVVKGFLFKDGQPASGHVLRTSTGGKGKYRMANHSRVTDCAIVNFNLPDKKKNVKWMSIWGRNNRIDHCYFAGKTGLGDTIRVFVNTDGAPSDHRIDHNHCGPRPPLGANGGETFRVGTGGERSKVNANVVVEENLFYRCNGEGEIFSIKCNENTIRYNTFIECQGAVTLRTSDRCKVYGNFFFGRNVGSGVAGATGGVRVIGEDHLVANNYFSGLTGTRSSSAVSIMTGCTGGAYRPVKNTRIAFNTFVDCRTALYLGLSYDRKDQIHPPENCVIANNLLVGVATATGIVSDNPMKNLTWTGNIAMGNVTGIPARSGIRKAPLQGKVEPDGIWRPAPRSAAVDSAKGDWPGVADDAGGRPRSGAKDVGATEVSSAPTGRHPLTPADVGPSWWPASKRPID